MKIKNYNSAIHNFAHSFQSIDYTHSGILVVNSLFELYNRELETKLSFDFINRIISPFTQSNDRNNELINDYLEWLPQHLLNHNCDISILESLVIDVKIDFNNIRTPFTMNNVREFEIESEVKWKIRNKQTQIITISQTELVLFELFKSGIIEQRNPYEPNT